MKRMNLNPFELMMFIFFIVITFSVIIQYPNLIVLSFGIAIETILITALYMRFVEVKE